MTTKTQREFMWTVKQWLMANAENDKMVKTFQYQFALEWLGDYLAKGGKLKYVEERNHYHAN